MKSSSTYSETIENTLPGDSQGRTTWFDSLNEFQQQETRRQIDFKKKHLPPMPNGSWSKRPNYTYPHIMPKGNEHFAYYGGFASDVKKYLDDNEIAVHDEVLNLKSSQAACINFLFPFKQNLDLATRGFSPFFQKLDKVTRIEFEYTGDEIGEDGATKWLGEPPGGKRGQNRTSIDTAISWTDRAGRTHITLIEWKYTEASFGVCSTYAKAKKEERKSCLLMQGHVGHTMQTPCLLTSGGPYRSRKYWQHLEQAGISLARCKEIPGCVFREAFYQLMRQYLLAAYLREVKKADDIDVVSISFQHNEAIRNLPRFLRPLKPFENANVIDTWNGLLVNVPAMREITVEDLMEHIDTVPGIDRNWREYLHERYNV